MTQLTLAEKDALREIATIGAGNASVALSQMLKHVVKVEVPLVDVVPVESMSDLMGKPEDLVTTVMLKIAGDVPGTMLLLFKPSDALLLANILTGRNRTGEGLDEMDKSALKEVGNILSGASINSLASFLSMILLQSIPDTATDMLRAVMEATAVEFGKDTDDVLVMQSKFSVAQKNFAGDIYLMFDPDSTRAIIDALHNKYQ